jgi:hypothetical protein
MQSCQLQPLFAGGFWFGSVPPAPELPPLQPLWELPAPLSLPLQPDEQPEKVAADPVIRPATQNPARINLRLLASMGVSFLFMGKGRFPPGAGANNSDTAPVALFPSIIFKREGNDDAVSHLLPAICPSSAPILSELQRAGFSALVEGDTVYRHSGFNVFFQDREYDGSAWHGSYLLLNHILKIGSSSRFLTSILILTVGMERPSVPAG